MDEKKFKKWLNTRYSSGTVSSRLANCRRIEQFEGNLDKEFDADQGSRLLCKLEYSADDQSHNLRAKHNIPINGDKRTGTATLKQAARLYFEFRNSQDPFSGAPKVQNKIIPNGIPVKKTKRVWPDWDCPSDQELFEIFKLIAKYSKFLEPRIIAKIVQNNKEHKLYWAEKLQSKGINPEIYLWDDSPCAFPGVRRYAGSKEIAFFKGHTQLDGDYPNDAVKLDDNDYPKHLWSWVFQSQEFRKIGPAGYSLAHLADHKTHNNRAVFEFIKSEKWTGYPLFGLYTSAANTCYIPNSLIKPTDSSPIIRELLIAKAFQLYGDVCNLIPPWLSLKGESLGGWNIDDFPWGNTVGNVENLDLFFEFRKKKIESFFL